MHAADIQDRDGGALVMATMFGLYPFLLKLYADGRDRGTRGLRPRCHFFMNRFRQLGFIDYNGGIAVHSSLLNAVLHDQPQIKI